MGQVKLSMDKYLMALLLVPGKVYIFAISTPLYKGLFHHAYTVMDPEGIQGVHLNPSLRPSYMYSIFMGIFL